ncbi:MAG: hypothetical protein K9L32_08300 [Chromatiaceae bacterium]|nr:hypothetical protein [Chromatiaceae bacterium]MCF8004191.1 hypothetical protein [Chromatiaceae bacterium]MCF8015826.1 hypothetical protein [Chromatiaceae bacterium]
MSPEKPSTAHAQTAAAIPAPKPKQQRRPKRPMTATEAISTIVVLIGLPILLIDYSGLFLIIPGLAVYLYARITYKPIVFEELDANWLHSMPASESNAPSRENQPPVHATAPASQHRYPDLPATPTAMHPADHPKPGLSDSEECWITAGEGVFRSGPKAAPLPPLDSPAIQRLWLGGFAMAWLDRMEPNDEPQDSPDGWLCEDDVRAVLTQRLADYPELLDQLNTCGINTPR